MAVLIAGGFALSACAEGGGGNRGNNSVSKGDGLVAEVANFDLAVGRTRFMVGILTEDRQFVSYGSVTLRFTYGRGDTEAPLKPGPTATATFISVPGSPPATSRDGPVALPSSEGKGVYGADVAFDRAGFWQVEVRANLIGEDEPRTASAAFAVRDKHLIPAPGDDAIPSQNLTAASTGVPPGAIDSRADTPQELPDRALHQTTIANAIAQHRPAVVVFATPV
jgi:hypothetical protein